MKNTVFRKTPFNGYNRDDVVEYIEQMDIETGLTKANFITLESDLNDRISTLEQTNSELEKKLINSEALISEKAKLIDELNNKQSENNKTIAELNISLNKQIELTTQLSAKPNLNDEISEKETMIHNLISQIDEKENMINELTQQIQNKEKHIKDITHKLEIINDDKILCEEIIKNFDEILEEVKVEAEKIKNQATQRANAIIATAKREKPEVHQRRVEDKSSIIEKIALLRKSLINK